MLQFELSAKKVWRRIHASESMRGFCFAGLVVKYKICACVCVCVCVYVCVLEESLKKMSQAACRLYMYKLSNIYFISPFPDLGQDTTDHMKYPK